LNVIQHAFQRIDALPGRGIMPAIQALTLAHIDFFTEWISQYKT